MYLSRWVCSWKLMPRMKFVDLQGATVTGLQILFYTQTHTLALTTVCLAQLSIYWAIVVRSLPFKPHKNQWSQECYNIGNTSLLTMASSINKDWLPHRRAAVLSTASANGHLLELKASPGRTGVLSTWHNSLLNLIFALISFAILTL